MPGIHWLASYPKSGNTWVRVFLHNLVLNPEHPVDINTLSAATIAYDRELFDDYLGLESRDLSHEQIDRYRPAYYERMAGKSKFSYVKTHERYRYTQEGTPIFSSKATSGAVLIVRDPRDIAVSMARCWRIDVAAAVKILSDSNLTLPNAADVADETLPSHVGSWSGHTLSWLASDPPLLVIRYEDMVHSPMDTFSEIARFLDVSHTQTEIERAIERSSFAALKQQETKAGFREHHVPGTPFFRSGQAGEGAAVLDEELQQQIATEHGRAAARLGYHLSA